MSASINKSYVNEILQVLNSTGNDFGKYPIGNKDLTQRATALEFAGVIIFDKIINRWKPNLINSRVNKGRLTNG